MRTRARAGAVFSAACSDEPWGARSRPSCWPSASRSCWACPLGCCTTCCGPSDSAGPGSPAFWMASTASPWGRCPSCSCCAGPTASCGVSWCWAPWEERSCFSAFFLSFSARYGLFGPILWSAWRICYLFPYYGSKILVKKRPGTEKISFILQGNAIQ